MFSTFTGASKRPRNVNLSGGAGNPFTNTSWSPSAVSNATKTVTNAQADREKRQAERRRTKAACSIQRAWRGHRGRQTAAQLRRDAFDALYPEFGNDPTCIPRAFNLLVDFFTTRRDDDIDRLLIYVKWCKQTQLSQLCSPGVPKSKLERLIQILVEALDHEVSRRPEKVNSEPLFLLVRLAISQPELLTRHLDEYYRTLAKLCRASGIHAELEDTLFDAIQAPLIQDIEIPATYLDDNIDTSRDIELQTKAYQTMVSRFLTQDIGTMEQQSQRLLRIFQFDKVERSILTSYATIRQQNSVEGLLQLLARYITLAQCSPKQSDTVVHLRVLQMQLATLAPDIAHRAAVYQSSAAFSENTERGPMSDPLESALLKQLIGLVSHESMSTLLGQLSISLEDDSAQGLESASLFTGYISTLLLCFPAQADDIRMRLFLTAVPSTRGSIPLIRLLWQKVRSSSLVRRIVTESEPPVSLLRDFILGNSTRSQHKLERQEWQVLLLFLEQYVFVLRLSDDEDFFSAIKPQLVDEPGTPSRIRSSSLSLADLKILTVFLKNTAFALHYKSREILNQHHSSSWGGSFGIDEGKRKANSSDSSTSLEPTQGQPIKTDLETFRGIITSVMKMLYERDSRNQFLPTGHWLMTDKLNKDGFIAAVIAEEERRNLENTPESSDEDDSDVDASPLVPRARYGMSAHGSRLTQHARMERLRHEQQKLQKDRKLAEMAPKLEILKHMPFVVPFDTRVKIFQQFIKLDMAQRRDEQSFADMATGHSRLRGNIRRGHLFEDAYREFYKWGENLKDQIQITFLDEFEMPEAGIDGGGVTKEFLTSVTSDAFSTAEDSTALSKFSVSDQGQLYPNPIAVDCMREQARNREAEGNNIDANLFVAEYLKRYEFLGRIIGKCLYEGILIDISFAGFFLLQWATAGSKDEAAYKGSMNDLRDMDEELYKGMLRLKNYTGDVSDLGIDFTIEDQVSLPDAPRKVISKRLIPNGDKIFVTNDNRLLYISYVARHRLVSQPALQTAAFLRGLRLIIRPSWLSMFNQSELQRLVGGDSRPIDLDDLRQNIMYSGLYEIGTDGLEHPTIVLFWKVLKTFTDSQVRDLLKYVTSTPRAPLLGFSQLRPIFTIRDAGRDQARLPSTSTCVNLLKLPMYTEEETLRQKLLYAISSNAGFDLS